MNSSRLLVALMVFVLCSCTGGGTRQTREQADTRARQASDTNVALAARYYSQGKVEFALEKAKRAVTIDPTNSMAHSITGVIYEVIGDSKAASQYYKKSVELDPDNPEALNNYGQYLCRNGDSEKGISFLERAVDQPFYKTPEVALISAGDCAEQNNNLAAAESFYRRALRVDDDYPDALYRLSILMLVNGEPLKARGFLQRLEAAGQLEPELLELGVRIEEALGNSKGATEYRERLRKFNPDAPTR